MYPHPRGRSNGGGRADNSFDSGPVTGLAFASPTSIGTCDGKPCWRATKKGFRFTDRTAGGDGVRQVVLQAGAAGRSKMQVRAQGDGLAPPALPLAQGPQLTVQLKNDVGQCWEATYAAPAKRNDAERFKDRAS